MAKQLVLEHGANVARIAADLIDAGHNPCRPDFVKSATVPTPDLICARGTSNIPAIFIQHEDSTSGYPSGSEPVPPIGSRRDHACLPMVVAPKPGEEFRLTHRVGA